MAATLIHDATIVTVDDSDAILYDAALLVRAGAIAALGQRRVEWPAGRWAGEGVDCWGGAQRAPGQRGVRGGRVRQQPDPPAGRPDPFGLQPPRAERTLTRAAGARARWHGTQRARRRGP